jgi:hypothetical protein
LLNPERSEVRVATTTNSTGGVAGAVFDIGASECNCTGLCSTTAVYRNSDAPPVPRDTLFGVCPANVVRERSFMASSYLDLDASGVVSPENSDVPVSKDTLFGVCPANVVRERSFMASSYLDLDASGVVSPESDFKLNGVLVSELRPCSSGNAGECWYVAERTMAALSRLRPGLELGYRV